VTLLQGDFFDLDGTFDAALDRAALVALPPETRPGYAQHLRARLLPAAPLLLVTIEYDARRREGPPYPVFPDEVRRLFPSSVERGRRPLLRPRWDSVGGADAVLWVARMERDGSR
jgi:thiopurine S-methyltransferase